MKKIAVSLPDERVERARRAVAEGRAPSVSAYVADALARREGEDDAEALIADMISQGGEPDADDVTWARRALGLG